LSSLHYTRK